MNPPETGERRADLKTQLLERLHDPLQLRIFIMAVVLLAGYFAVYEPLSDRIAATTQRISRDKRLLELGESIEQLRKRRQIFHDRLPSAADAKEWVQYVLAGIRQFPLKLCNLDCRNPKAVGPYWAIVLQMELEGSYYDIDKLVSWLESNRRLFRIDSFRISWSPNTHKNTVYLTVLGMAG
jgi:Tfp pilus assembly protein PilO